MRDEAEEEARREAIVKANPWRPDEENQVEYMERLTKLLGLEGEPAPAGPPATKRPSAPEEPPTYRLPYPDD